MVIIFIESGMQVSIPDSITSPSADISKSSAGHNTMIGRDLQRLFRFMCALIHISIACKSAYPLDQEIPKFRDSLAMR